MGNDGQLHNKAMMVVERIRWIGEVLFFILIVKYGVGSDGHFTIRNND